MSQKSTYRVQQQPPRQSDPQQQQSGSSDFQPRPAAVKPLQIGEGSYERSQDSKGK